MQVQYAELTDAQWDLIEPLFPVRKRNQDLRVILNAIFWINRTGAQWRNLDSKFPYWQIVYYYFSVWSELQIIAKINLFLVQQAREQANKQATPSANVIDSQSVKIAPMIAEDKGIDGGKKVNGRKRHVVTDTMGLVLLVSVHAANISDSKGGCMLFERFKTAFENTSCIFADKAYGGKFRERVAAMGIRLEIASKPETMRGFVPLKKRWVIERTFGQFNFFRRLSKDYERCTIFSEAHILLAQIQILLHKLTV